MAGKIKTAIIALITVLGLETALHGAENAAQSTNIHRIEGPAGQFTIDLPPDWKPIDPTVLQALTDPYARDHVVESGKVLQFGYGPELSETMTNPPYLVVELNRTRRLPERVMALQSNTNFFRRVLENSFKKNGVLEYKILEANYDSQRHVVHLVFTQTDPITRSELRNVESVLYTQDGAVRVAAVCPSAEWNVWTNTIESALASVTIPERLHYQARPGLEIAAQSASSLRLLLALAVPLVSMVVWFILNRHSGQVMSDEI
jgi:hypothetical protein